MASSIVLQNNRISKDINVLLFVASKALEYKLQAEADAKVAKLPEVTTIVRSKEMIKDPKKGYNGLELRVKQILEEKIFPGYKFWKVRPSWLLNPQTKRNLELDLYCEKLKLAVEIQGPQHYEKVNHYHASEQDFIDQKQRDLVKSILCKKHGIKLVYVDTRIDKYDLETQIKQQFA